MTYSHTAETQELAALAPQDGVLSVAPYMLTYGIAFILIFFVMGGYLPTSGTRASSLGGTTSETDTMLGQLFQAVTWAFALVLMLPYTRQILDACLNLKAMICLPVLAIGSAVWSQDPAGSLRRGVFLMLGTLFAVYLTRRFAVENLAQIVVVAGVIAGILGIVVSIAFPQYGRDTFNGDAWQGIFRSKNGCAQIMLFFLTAALCFRFHTRFMEMLRRSLFPIAALLIVMSQAKTAWLLGPGLLLLAGLLGRLGRFERRNAMLLLTALVLLLVAGSAALPYFLPILLGALGKDPEMSGRLPLWLASIASAIKQPWLGYGYAAFWTGMRGESLNVFLSTRFEIFQAQNGLLEVWLELGLAGVALVSLTLAQAARNIVTCLQQGFSAATNWYICLFALTVAYNVDETFLGSAHSLPWLLFLVACTGLADRARQLRSLPSTVEQPGARPFASRHHRPALNQPQPA